MGAQGQITLDVRGGSTPGGGPTVGLWSTLLTDKQFWANGQSGNQIDRWYDSGEIEIAASGSQAFDLSALSDPSGSTVDLAEVRLLIVQVKGDDAGVLTGDHVTFDEGASNAWTALTGGTSPVIKLNRGGIYPLIINGTDGKYAVGASDKVFDITNTDSSNEVVIRVIIAGVSS